ncbi:MAG TPA: SCO family protein [Terriglobales bacterium]|nr:SCO family protein [Terriglobales bacterium]
MYPMKRFVPILTILLTSAAWAAQQYRATGMVMSVDRAHRSFVVSCKEIPGFMSAMMMPLNVHEANELDGLTPGTVIEFTLLVDQNSSYAKGIHIHLYQSAEQDPWRARQLTFLSTLGNNGNGPKLLAIGQKVPDFTLIDQERRTISLSQFAGKVVALNFVYTSCALPNFCYRIANNFGVVQRHFKDQMGGSLVLLTVTFDPQRDQPEVLAKYAQQWKADPKTWHFLTGAVPDVQRVTDMFGMEFFPDEGLMYHSLHTAVIDREGKLVANIEGNQFTAEQLSDLIQTVLDRAPAKPQSAHVAHTAPPKS